MASNRYISPIRLFIHLGIDFLHEVRVPRIRKQIAAEFALAPEGIITLDGFSYTKHDVLAEVERPDFEVRLPYHVRIWNDPVLLRLLETGEADLGRIEQPLTALGGDPKYCDLFCPYFAEPFAQVSRGYIRQQRLDQLGEWYRYVSFVDPQDSEEAFRPVRTLLEETIRTVRNLSQQNYKVFHPELAAWLRPGWAAFVNNLPDDLYEERERIIHSLIRVTVQAQHISTSDCKVISIELVRLKRVDEETAGVIRSNHDIFTSNRFRFRIGSVLSGKRGPSWNYWFAALLLLRVVISMVHGCN